MTRIIFDEDLRQSNEYAAYMESLGWKVERIQSSKQTFKIYIKRFGLVKEARILRVNPPFPWKEIQSVLKENRVYTCRIEPRSGLNIDKELFAKGFKLDESPFRATKTCLIDLRVGERDLLKNFKRARSKIRKLENAKHNITLGESEGFYEIWKSSAKRQGIWYSTKNDYDNLILNFKDSCFALCVDGMCGCLILLHKQVAHYYYGATLPQARDNGLGYLVVWAAIKEAKKRKCILWDWEGIYDPRWPKKSWLGFSQFKKSFGGVEFEMPGSFVRKSVSDLLGL